MPHRVLIVDDTPVNLKLLERIVAREGHGAILADNGRDALRLAETEHPDLVLLDVLMPHMDGYAVCATLKRNPSTRDIPVIFLSALHDVGDRVKGLRLGAVDFIVKPFADGEVAARMAAQLERRRMEAEARAQAARAERAERRRAIERGRIGGLVERLLPVWPRETRGLRWSVEACDGRTAFVGAWALDRDHAAAFLVVAGATGPLPRLLAASAMQRVVVEEGGLGWRGAAGNGSGPAVPPGEVLAALDREFPVEVHGHLLAAAYLLLHRGTGLLRHAAAGLAPIALERADGSRVVLDGAGLPIGAGPGDGGARF